jgi:N4-(beta-N-acetylglucosaminyl)-L-asparaginase
MKPEVKRRDFVLSGAAAGAAALVAGKATAGPAILSRASLDPVVVSSANGHYFKNGGSETAVERAFRGLTSGEDVLESVVAGVKIVELDPEEDSVGYGGLPNADGVVQLDASCMHGGKRRAGAVAALEGVRTPSLVAQAVLHQTDHHLLVGKGAQDFARHMGFRIEEDLNTDHSRRMWLEWKRRIDPLHYLDPEKRAEAVDHASQRMVADGFLRSRRLHGTINMLAVSARGELAGVTTTSGLAWKIPGRVGDSPILGAGLYVDGDVGGAGSTGRGEANLYGLCSFLIVEEMRRGLAPKDAGLEALRRIKGATLEKRLRRSDGNPNFNVTFYVVNTKGEHAAVALYAHDAEKVGSLGQADDVVRYAFCNADGPQRLAVEGLLAGRPQD